MKNYNKLIENISDNEVYVITSPHNLHYFSGFTGGEGIAAIGKNFKILFTDGRYIEIAEKEAEDFKIIDCVPYYLNLKSIFIENKIETVYFEDKFLSVNEFDKIKSFLPEDIVFKGVSNDIEELRIIKNEYEISCINKAEGIASDAFSYVLGKIKEGITELEVAAEIEYFMKKNGAEKTSFDTIVISGSKTSMPHGTPSNRKILVGDFITMDFGCKYNGFCSDMTRTVVFGKANEKQKEIYDIVLNAQLSSLEYISAGKKASDCDLIARDLIKNAGYEKNFSHSLGHGVGLLIHELPNVSSKSEFVLKENMVISCEPGIYIPGFGGVRIEDLVVVKENGIINLTNADKKFLVI